MIWTIISWIIIGGIAGWLAGLFMKSRKSSILGNIILGILGSLVGGFVAGLLGISAAQFSIGGILIAFAGACIIIAIARAIRR